MISFFLIVFFIYILIFEKNFFLDFDCSSESKISSVKRFRRAEPGVPGVLWTSIPSFIFQKKKKKKIVTEFEGWKKLTNNETSLFIEEKN